MLLCWRPKVKNGSSRANLMHVSQWSHNERPHHRKCLACVMSRTIYLRIISVFMNDIKAVLDHQNHNLFSILLFSLFSLSKLQFLSLCVCVCDSFSYKILRISRSVILTDSLWTYGWWLWYICVHKGRTWLLSFIGFHGKRIGVNRTLT